MPVFTGPTRTGAAYRGSTPGAAALFAHYGTVTEGRNVYILNSGVVTEQYPADPSTISHVLWGGRAESITSAEATLLTNAGYGVYVT